MKKIVILIVGSVFCSILIFPVRVNAQVFINEFMASNTGSIVDPDYKESADWLELYNSGASSVNIGGFYLTDNFNDKLNRTSL